MKYFVNINHQQKQILGGYVAIQLCMIFGEMNKDELFIYRWPWFHEFTVISPLLLK